MWTVRGWPGLGTVTLSMIEEITTRLLGEWGMTRYADLPPYPGHPEARAGNPIATMPLLIDDQDHGRLAWALERLEAALAARLKLEPSGNGDPDGRTSASGPVAHSTAPAEGGHPDSRRHRDEIPRDRQTRIMTLREAASYYGDLTVRQFSGFIRDGSVLAYEHNRENWYFDVNQFPLHNRHLVAPLQRGSGEPEPTEAD